jgi:hypothetical protein
MNGPEWSSGPVEKPVRPPSLATTGVPMSFAIYLTGVVILLGGLIFGASLLHMPGEWIAVCAIILLGVSVLTGVAVTRHKDPA